MEMLELISGFIVGGAAGVALKDKIFGSGVTNIDAKQKELESVYAENEKSAKTCTGSMN